GTVQISIKYRHETCHFSADGCRVERLGEEACVSTQPAEEAPELDILLSGTVFLDIIFTGLDRLPGPGTEVWATGLGPSPGGIANLAVALSRLQLRTGLAAAFGEDAYGDFCWDI